jgi:hypothetical protein
VIGAGTTENAPTHLSFQPSMCVATRESGLSESLEQSGVFTLGWPAHLQVCRSKEIQRVMTSDEGDEEQTVEIVYGYVRTDPDDPDSLEPRTKTVSADWYESHRHAEDVLQQVMDEWIQKRGVRSVGLGGDDEPVISVTVVHTSEFDQKFPETVDGVPVNVREIDPDKGQML